MKPTGITNQSSNFTSQQAIFSYLITEYLNYSVFPSQKKSL